MNPAAICTATARPEDLASVLAVQRRAFTRVARQLQIDPPQSLPPLCETLDELLALQRSGTRFFVARSATGAIIGSVRATPTAGTVDVGRLVVDDGWERRGVATALMDLLEDTFADAGSFRLFTGAEATAALALYTSRGYVEMGREQTPHVELVWLSKPGASQRTSPSGAPPSSGGIL